MQVRAAVRAVAAAAEPPEPSLTQLVAGTGGRNTELELKAAQRALAKLQVDRCCLLDTIELERTLCKTYFCVQMEARTRPADGPGLHTGATDQLDGVPEPG